jgi:hypothetical protein
MSSEPLTSEQLRQVADSSSVLVSVFGSVPSHFYTRDETTDSKSFFMFGPHGKISVTRVNGKMVVEMTAPGACDCACCNRKDSLLKQIAQSDEIIEDLNKFQNECNAKAMSSLRVQRNRLQLFAYASLVVSICLLLTLGYVKWPSN